GLGRYLADAGFTQIREVDWYEEVRHKGVQLIAYPAVHWANRSPFDVNRTLWMSYAVKGGGQVIYHSGDTEWHDQLFAQIGADMTRRLGACDLALLSVGAYAPRSFMRGAHADPEGAWRIGRAIGCRTMTPMHWGTFVLSLEPVMEPLERFRAAAGEAARLMRIGETQNLAAPPPQIPE
ncbi:MAG: MBL fold metallo-hydrolase, partial [Hyphomicrobiales bacterium]|nr:MBL fold metallo-hydrolase [Hyphomicrobiales bacterium]